MKWTLLAVLIFCQSQTFGKGRPSTGIKLDGINKVAPFEKEALAREVKWVVEGAINKIREIKDPKCENLNFFSDDDLLDVTVNEQHFYIVISDTFIATKKYHRSSCAKATNGEVVEIECVARSEDAIENLDEEDKLVFYTKYDSKSILVCPAVGAISK